MRLPELSDTVQCKPPALWSWPDDWLIHMTWIRHAFGWISETFSALGYREAAQQGWYHVGEEP